MKKTMVMSAIFAFVCAAVWAAGSGFFAGRVTSSQWRPIEGAEVSAYVKAKPSVTSGFKFLGSDATDKDGKFRIEDIQASKVYTIVIKASGYERQKWNVIGARYLPIRLRPATGSIFGRVVDRDDKPVSGVWVKIGVGADSLYTDRTGIDGRFEFHDLIPGAMVAVCVGGDTFTKSARVGTKDVKMTVEPDRVKDFKPWFPDDQGGSLLNRIIEKIKP